MKWYSAPRRPQSRVETLWDDTTRSRCTERSSVAPWLTCVPTGSLDYSSPFCLFAVFFDGGARPLYHGPLCTKFSTKGAPNSRLLL